MPRITALCLLSITLPFTGCAGFKLRQTPVATKQTTIIVKKAGANFWEQLKLDPRFIVKTHCDAARCLVINSLTETTNRNSTNFSNYVNFITIELDANYTFINKQQKPLLPLAKELNVKSTTQVNSNILLAESDKLQNDKTKLYKQLLNKLISLYRLSV